jgi:SAM-dependent methyltransferase
MTDWTAGYVADIDYTFGYYAELNPLRAKLAFLEAGLVPPKLGTHCELGFGQGLSVNMHAAASGSTWYATDFNPAQAGFAQSVALASGADAHIFDDAFADFCARTDLPDFDSIGLHGIWSWISDENRSVIVDFIRRKLKVGGVLYISYNTQPGWAAFSPMRHLMIEHAEKLGAKGHGILHRVGGALDFAEKLLSTHPAYAKANPQIAQRIAKIKGQNRHYLAHEYFNRDWLPMHFATMAEWLSPAKLSYACSANYLDHVDALNLTREQQTLLKELPDAMFRESVRDFMTNQQFRRDYWVKGLRKLNSLERNETILQQRLLLVAPRPDVSLVVNGPGGGKATMSEAIYNPILDLLSDHQARKLGEIALALRGQRISHNQMLEAMTVLVGQGHLAAVQEDAQIAKAKQSTHKLNLHLIDKARSSSDINSLASPVTGGGIAVERFQQLFLLAISQGQQQPGEWTQFVWQTLVARGQKIVKEGKPLESAEDNIAELGQIANSFAEKRLPVLKALQIA